MSDSQGSNSQRSSVADILAKMKQNGEWDGELGFADSQSNQTKSADTTQSKPPVQPTAQQSHASSPVTANQVPVTANQPPVAENQDGDEMSQYLAQFMNRYGSGSGSGSSNDKPTSGAKGNMPKGLPESLANAEPEKIMQLLKECDYRPSQVAPEKGKNLDALRQLANQSTRSAVAEHGVKRLKFLKSFRIGLFAFAIIAATAFFVTSNGWTDPSMYAAIGITLIAMFSGCMVFVTKNGSPKQKSDNAQSNTESQK
jgi:hypothetical protein